MDKIKENLTNFRVQVAQLNGATEEEATKKAANAAQEFKSIPLEGTIEKPDFEVYGFEKGTVTQLDDKTREEVKTRILSGETNIPNIRVSVGYRLASGEFVSENQFSASTVTLRTIVVKSTKNAGKHMLAQEKISPDYYKLGDSADKRYLALIGKTYKAEKFQGLALKKYDSENMFADKNLTPEIALETLKINTEPKTYHRFAIS